MTILNSLASLSSIDPKDFQSCIDVVEHDQVIKGINTTLRFHHLKFDGNGRPMVKQLAEVMYQNIIDYCISTKNRLEPFTSKQAAMLTKEARKLFRHPEISEDEPDQTGEAGETLLFLLVEAILKAPQLVTKMELKTNSHDEVKGSDGIHARWNAEEKMVEFYFGEAKLYKDLGAAIKSAISSVKSFHENEMYKHEFKLVTKHFKYADDAIKNEIIELIRLGEPGPGAKIKHACLIGYDWNEFKNLLEVSNPNIHSLFLEKYNSDLTRLASLVQKNFSTFELKYLCFDFFFIPFPSVSDFRNEFNKALD